jgi:glycosyltransferase involved in cell wall biosynthesis
MERTIRIAATLRSGKISSDGLLSMSAIPFSVIITCHNQASFIRDAVESALSQTVAPQQIIVVDDASSDGSPEILKAYGDKIQFAGFQTNQGANTARNLGAAMSTGKYLVFLDGDDVLLPWALDVYRRVVDLRNPKIILSQMRWFEGAVPLLLPEEHPRQIEFVEYEVLVDKNRNYQPGASAIVIDTDTFRSVKGWTDELFGVEDVDLMLKLGSAGLTVHILSPETKGYRIHASNTRHHIPKMVDGLFNVLAHERSGIYPGGQKLRFGRYVIIGAPVFFWFKSAYRAKQFGTAASVLARGWKMFAAAGARKVMTFITGRKAPQISPLTLESIDSRHLADSSEHVHHPVS